MNTEPKRRTGGIPAPEDRRVVVVDDDDDLRAAMLRLLDAAGYTAVGFHRAEGLLDGPPLATMRCILLDLRLPGMSGLALFDRISSDPDCPPVVFLTAVGDVPSAVHTLKAGALDFLTKPVSADVLIPLLQRALKTDADRWKARRAIVRLTPREREVLAEVVKGGTNAEIGDAMGIAEKTVKIHRGRVYKKLGARNTVDLGRLTRLAKGRGGDAST